MKILYHHRTRRTGVEGVHVAGIINAFRSLGHEVIECALIANNKSPAREIPKQSTWRKKIFNFISMHAPEHIFKLLEIFYNIISYSKLKNIIKQNNIDFIYDRYALFSLSPVLIAKQYNIPIICEVNIIASLEDARKIKFRRLAQKFEKYILNNAQYILVVSSYLKKKIRDSGCRTSILVLPNAIDPNTFIIKKNNTWCLKYRKPKNIILIGFMGRLLPWYKLDEALKAIHRLAHQGYPVHFLIVGEGECKGMLENLSQKLGVEARLHMLGYIDHNMTPYYLDKFDIAILPSANKWGSPMKIFEYMVMGKPVIAPSYDPVKEIIIDGVTGLLFKKNDFNEMGNKIKMLLDDSHLRKTLGEKGKDYILKKHTWINNANEILKEIPRDSLQFHLK